MTFRKIWIRQLELLFPMYGKINMFQSLLTMIPVRENSEVVMKFTQKPWCPFHGFLCCGAPASARRPPPLPSRAWRDFEASLGAQRMNEQCRDAADADGAWNHVGMSQCHKPVIFLMVGIPPIKIVIRLGGWCKWHCYTNIFWVFLSSCHEMSCVFRV